MSNDPSKFRLAIDLIDAANARDPNGDAVHYSQRMTHWLGVLSPDASEPLRLAARAQHIRRWEIPRDSFPMDRIGYLNWRKSLYEFHAKVAGEILGKIGYDQPTIERVGALLRKQRLKADPEMQTLEDVICLVFLEGYFADFAKDKDEPKLLNIIKKTWAKMSEQGHAAALKLPLPADELALIQKALRPANTEGFNRADESSP